MEESIKGVGVLQYFHVYVGLKHYFGFKIPVKSIFWGYEESVDFFFFFFFFGGGGGAGGLSLQNCTIYFGVSFPYILGSRCFGTAKFQIFFGYAWYSWYWYFLIILTYYFGVNSRYWVQAYVWRKIENTPWGVLEFRFILLL